MATVRDDMILVSRRPTHPGEVLREEFMPDYGLTVAQLATLLSTSRQSVNELVRERRGVSPDMALRLARLFGTSPRYWLNLQHGVDLWDSLDLDRDAIEAIEPLPVIAVG
ncbi:MAG: HigA family addiction module antidote protein [Eggerthellaceae bacterium]|nr:HigA family addiction module antidote protein [Eggerthellaceae bacterium]